MSPVRIAINGFGRIGRNVLRLSAGNPDIEIVGINDLTDVAMLAHLLKYDSIFGPARFDVQVEGDAILVDGKKIAITKQTDPTKLPWKELGVDIALECTGHFTARNDAAAHLTAGARKVIISAPGKDADLTCVYGVNHTNLDLSKHDIISNASCTTNCLAPVAKILHEQFGIESGFMTTIHAYTNDQKLMDSPHKDPRRSRAAALSQIPTSTGAARAVGLVLPELLGKLDGMAIRVPTPNVSCLDLTVKLTKPATAEAANAALKTAAGGELNGVLRYCDEPLVSIDFLGDKHSSIVDALSTSANGDLLKVLAWYDNEAGFSHRMIDMSTYIGKQL